MRACASTRPPRCRPTRSSVPAPASGTRPRCASTPASAPAASSARTSTSMSSVVVGDRVKIQNNVSLFHGVTVEDGVFIGPHVCFTNDRRAAGRQPRRLAQDRCRLGGLADPRPFRSRARREQHDPAGRDDRPLGDGRRRQRRHRATWPTTSWSPATRRDGSGARAPCGAAAARRRRGAVRRRLPRAAARRSRRSRIA